MSKNQKPKRGPSQEERRRQAINRPLGGNVQPRKPESSKSSSGSSSGSTGIQRASAIVAVIMLVAILLSLIPACFSQVGTAAALEQSARYSALNQDVPAPATGYPGARFLHREAAEQAPTASLARPEEKPPDNRLYIGDTGHYIGGIFLVYWRQQGGAAVFGNPLSEEYNQNGHTVQLFEKALLEFHPEETEVKNQIQLGFLGRQLAAARRLSFSPLPNPGASASRAFFPETNQVLAGKFKTYWDKNNGLGFLGFPLSGEISEAGQTVQYFERGYLRSQAGSNKVEVGPAGWDLIEAKGWPRPTRLELDLNIDGDEIYQGRTLAVRLEPDAAWEPQDLAGSVGSEALKLVRTGPAYRAFKAFAPWSDVKAYPLNITYTDPAGRKRELSQPINVVKYDFKEQNLYLPDDKQDLVDQANEDYDNAQLAEAYNTFTPQMLWSGFWAWPAVGEITTEFAQRRAFGDATGDASRYYHGGIDIAQNLGAPIAAPANGKVIYTGTLKVRGNTVVIDHGMGVTSYYCHLNKILVKPGDVLKKGQILGQTGTTGRSNGPHLHWEVRVNGVITYPELFLRLDLSY